MYERINEWIKGKWTNEWMNEWINELMNEWINEWMNEWMNEWINKWMNEWMNEYNKGQIAHTRTRTVIYREKLLFKQSIQSVSLWDQGSLTDKRAK